MLNITRVENGFTCEVEGRLHVFTTPKALSVFVLDWATEAGRPKPQTLMDVLTPEPPVEDTRIGMSEINRREREKAYTRLIGP